MWRRPQLLRRSLPASIGITWLLAGCNPGQSPAIANSPNGSPQNAPTTAIPAPIAKGVPHGGVITEVAITEQADAALSFDNLLGIRLWPTLDGTRPPVPVTANAPRQLALSHAGRELLAVVLDDAGAVQLLRLGLDGSVKGHASLPGQYVQVLAIDSGVIVRTPDHAVEWYAADGTAKGRVMPEPGMQVQGIATRNGHTAVLLANATSNLARTIQWLSLGESLTWGKSVEVPSAIQDGMFAVSPNGKRVAYASASAIEVYELDGFARVIPGDSPVTHREGDRAIGFIDDESVVVGAIGTTFLWRPKKPEPPAPPPQPTDDPWAVPTTYVSPHPSTMSMPKDSSMVDGFAYGNGVVVYGNGVTLAISNDTATRYLGWKELAAGNLTLAGDQLTMGLSASRYVWLDGNLEVKRDVELHENELAPWLYGIPIDEHHVVTQTNHDGHFEIALVDLDSKATSKPAQYPESERNDYTPSSQLFAVGERHKVDRYKLDLVANTMTALDPIKVKGSPVSIRLFDPAKANRTTAAVVGWDSDYADYQTLTIYAEHGKKTRIHPFDGQILSETADGTLYVWWRHGSSELRVMKDGKVTQKIALEGATMTSVNQDASRIAFVDAKGNVIVLDGATNKQLWHQPLWGAQQVQFTADGKKLFVRAIGGIASYDATTGIRTGLECGWNFGLYDEAIGSSPPGQSLVCEDPMLQ